MSRFQVPLLSEWTQGFPQGVENKQGCAPLPIGEEALQNLGSLSQYMGMSTWELKIKFKNTCEEVYLLVKLPAISLQARKFAKNELLLTHFSSVFARF